MLKTLKNEISLSIFKNQNNISYNLFNKIYKIFKSTSNFDSQTVLNFIKNGYSTSISIKEAEIDTIKYNLNKTHKDYSNNVTNYLFNEHLKILIKNFFINNFKDEIKKFSDFYSSRIIVSHVKIFTNHGFDQKENKKEQFFSEKYHTDNYHFTYFKLFINLENVNNEKGPLHFVPKPNLEKFIKITKYKNRFSYNEKDTKDLIFKNVGKKGDSLFVNTTQCIHRAGIPSENETRTILLFHLNAIPGKKDNINYFEYEDSSEDIFLTDYWSRYFAKPRKFSESFKLLRNFLF